MSFVHPLLLGGLLLVGIPVLIHLIMQQKPKHLLFPAFRFLLQKQRTNQRRLRLRHILLLALRIVLIAAICLALARPKFFSSRIGIGGNRPVAAVLVFDTSLSMGYQVAKQTRLDEAKRRALELLDSLPDGSRIAVLDTAEPGGEWLNTRTQVEDRITGLKLQPVNAPVTRQIAQAYLSFKALDQEQTEPGEALPQVLCVFSDRTTGCWDGSEAKGLHPPEGLNTVFVDVGVDNPVDLAITDVKVPRPVVHPGQQADIRFTVISTGDPGENEVTCLNDDRARKKTPDKKPVRLAADSREEKDFEQVAARRGESSDVSGRMSNGWQQFTIRLSADDSMPFNDFAYATLKVEEGRKVLIITDKPGKRPEEGDAGRWLEAMNAWQFFPCTVVSTEDAADYGIKQLSEFEAIVLIDVANPSPLWDRLRIYVEEKGKGLAIVLGGADWQPSHDAYNKDPGRTVFGAKLEQREDVGDNPGYTWREMEPDTSKAVFHPLIRYFRDKLDVGLGRHFTEDSVPQARSFWKVNPDKGKARPIASYADKENSPAILERRLEKGRVLIFTSALDGHIVNNHPANNYFDSWFGMGLMINATGYLAGDAETPNFNFICGQAVTVPLPQTQAMSFTLFGPDANGISIARGKGENELRITQAVQPGNYRIFDPTVDSTHPIAAFSLNAPPEESRLDRVPIDQIESLLGPGSVLSVERGLTLSDKIKGHWLQPLELFPWLMILVLLVLAVENLLSNKFYKRGNQAEPEPRAALASSERTAKELAEVHG
jgi:hypothetical protein